MSCRDKYFETARKLRAPLTSLNVVPVDGNEVVPVRAGLFMVESQRVTCNKAMKLIKEHTFPEFYMSPCKMQNVKLKISIILHLANYYIQIVPNSCATVCVYQHPRARESICLRPVLPTYEVHLHEK